MKNNDIRKAILKATNKIENFSLNVILWHGDGTYSGSNSLNIEVVISDEDNQLIDIERGIYADIEGIEDDIKKFKKEQKIIFRYLKKYFANVKLSEENI